VFVCWCAAVYGVIKNNNNNNNITQTITALTPETLNSRDPRPVSRSRFWPRCRYWRRGFCLGLSMLIRVDETFRLQVSRPGFWPRLRYAARFTKYLTAILRLSYDNAKVTIDLRRMSNLHIIRARLFLGTIHWQNRQILSETVFVISLRYC